MTSSSGWQSLPNHITDDIMLMAELGSLQDLHKCRQVCQRWNVMISQMTRLKKDQIRRKAESLAHQIKKKNWDTYQIVTAASLAHHKILGSVRRLDLIDLMDLSSIPP